MLLRHEAIADCVVIGLPDALWGEQVAAVIVTQLDTSIDSSTMRYRAPRRSKCVSSCWWKNFLGEGRSRPRCQMNFERASTQFTACYIGASFPRNPSIRDGPI